MAWLESVTGMSSASEFWDLKKFGRKETLPKCLIPSLGIGGKEGTKGLFGMGRKRILVFGRDVVVVVVVVGTVVVVSASVMVAVLMVKKGLMVVVVVKKGLAVVVVVKKGLVVVVVDTSFSSSSCVVVLAGLNVIALTRPPPLLP